MTRYTGTVTTSGKSEAIRLEKALFRSHPEFRQKAKVRADVIGPGTMLVSLAEDRPAAEGPDPVMAAFLSFLADDIARSPARVKPLAATRLDEARGLTTGVTVHDDEALPDDATL